MKFVFIVLMLFSFQTKANVLGDMQTFAPNTDGLDFITVHTGRPLTKGVWAFSNYFNYAYGHLLVYEDLNTQSKYSPYKDQLIEYDLDIAYALTDRFQIFFATPILLWQKPDQDQPIQVNVSKGSATYRPGFKYTLSDDSSGDSAVIASFETLTVRDSPYVGSNPQPIWNFEYAKTFKNRDLKYHGLNIGYRLRSPTQRPATARMFPIDDQVIASYGYSAPFTRTSRWVFETFASVPVSKGDYKNLTDATSLDFLLGLKHRWYRNLNFDWGVTVEPPGLETLAPQFRLFTGLVYYWKPESKSEPAEVVPVTPTATPEPEPEPEIATAPLRIIPETAEILEGSVLKMRAEGGDAPYKFRKLAGPVQVYPAGQVRALSPGVARVEVVDTFGKTKEAEIRIRAIPKPDQEIVLRNLNFIFDTDKLTKASKSILDKQLPNLQKLKISRLIIVGHTDSKGSDEYNLDLSERRAQAIKRILMSELSLSDSQVDAIGRGESMPIATNKTDAGRLRNRRVELKIYFRK